LERPGQEGENLQRPVVLENLKSASLIPRISGNRDTGSDQPTW